jgi:hypothetical protein
MKATHAIVVAVFVLNAAQYSHAELIILGNLPPANDNFGAAIDAGIDDVGSNFINVRRAVSFTMPSQSYPVEHVTLRLRAYVTTAGDVAAVGFYEDNGMDLPGAPVGSLLLGPPSASDATGQFEFTPADPLTLAASTKYWLLVDASAGEYQWQGSSPDIVPTSQVGAVFVEEVTLHGNTPDDRGVDEILSFEIVTNVPEPRLGAFALMLLAGLATKPLRRRIHQS